MRDIRKKFKIQKSKCKVGKRRIVKNSRESQGCQTSLASRIKKAKQRVLGEGAAGSICERGKFFWYRVRTFQRRALISATEYDDLSSYLGKYRGKNRSEFEARFPICL